jgi:deoxyribodipyrimidine photo-lyase
MTTSVVLFTRDLRVHDQAALHNAAAVSEKVVPLFVFDDSLVRSPAGQEFLLESLGDLRDSLRTRGGELFVRRGDPVEETLRVVRNVGASTVFIGADVSPYAQRRETQLARHAELRVENTIAAVPPGELAPAQRSHYRVFTPYWRRWNETPVQAPLDPPRRLIVPERLSPGRLAASRELRGGGETAGRRRLATWLSTGLFGYETKRNSLADDGTSRLSPYLHFGCVSAGETVTRARSEGDPAAEFVRQLCWRDFYLQLLAANPRAAVSDLRARKTRWVDDDAGFATWSEGRTGYPIVDAAMRQLRNEGWLHNRARLIVGAFLTRQLGIDWRRGADVFLRLLVDGDVPNNSGNWQWVAGTGVDPRPNRRFNVIAQAKRHDPDGDYVRQHVPELAELPGATIHEPWLAAVGARALHYPARIDE